MTDKLNLNKSGKVPRLPQLNSSLPKMPGLKTGAPSVPSLSLTKQPTASSSDANAALINQPAAPSAPDLASAITAPPAGVTPSAPDLAAAITAPPAGMTPSAPDFAAAITAPPAVMTPSAPNLTPAPDLAAALTAPPAAAPDFAAAAPQVDNSALDFNDPDLSDDPFEDDEGDDAGEKTMMLGAAMDDEDELDLGGEKTQITMSAMDFDPLSGKLIVESGKAPQREYILVRDKTRIGRAPKNDIAISDISMSREHVEIDKFPEGFRVRDLSSGNGTVLNGYRIRVGQLRDGDIIEVGSIKFRFEQSGGDPDVLWRGEPKIEYHPNQQKKPGGTPSAANMSAPSASSAPQIPAPQAPQMESMLQRQGGGIAAPAWPGASPMTSPYMMGYGANALRNVNTTPPWANFVLIGLIILCFCSLAWLVVTVIQNNSDKRQIAERQEIIKLINEDVEAGVSAYSNLHFSTALEKFNSAIERDPDETIIKDRELFNFYRKLITKEEDINKEIIKIRVKKKDIPVDEFEQDLRYLNDVPDGSVNKLLALSSINGVNDNFKSALKSNIRKSVNDNNISDARELLDKLRTLPDTSKDVKQLNKLITDKEKTLN